MPGSGREKMFEVREIESDISFLRNYLTKDLVMREDMYLFQKQGKEYKVVGKEWDTGTRPTCKYACEWWISLYYG